MDAWSRTSESERLAPKAPRRKSIRSHATDEEGLARGARGSRGARGGRVGVGSFIRFCAAGCKISIAQKYPTNNFKVYCTDCSNKKNAQTPLNEENWKELKNKNEAKEETLRCDRCDTKWHRCCSLELQKKSALLALGWMNHSSEKL
ncbi:hypothetical protein CAEBREN_04603 [Caenorhabditis brenneri]|uniref:Uncharacterized protein n=1 Tax=Caenorhabditis brenneri TaxID=135651 RepID=G0P3F7_CAEBE|nr:hypothetical protein CAEBREN_04603 [Caenorhabditis brenneri]